MAYILGKKDAYLNEFSLLRNFVSQGVERKRISRSSSKIQPDSEVFSVSSTTPLEAGTPIQQLEQGGQSKASEGSTASQMRQR